MTIAADTAGLSGLLALPDLLAQPAVLSLPPVLPLPLVLASTSRYRKAQLERLGIAFTCIAPDYAEDPVAGIAAGDLPRYHARHKALAVAEQSGAPQAWILAADQGVVWQNGSTAELLGKPHTQAKAVDQLLQLAGQPHLLRTAVALLLADGTLLDRVVDVTLHMRPLSHAEATDYVARDQPLDCAGSYRIESLGPWLFDKVDCDDPTAIEGLPLLAVAALLRQGLAHWNR
ncbi:MAG: Maf-like protein [Myxococcales bacterium]|nr:Maf-like protein [Myxococcales bacterium]